jgi:hypothetical protein
LDTREAGDGDGEESFDVIVASPRWLAVRCWEPSGILDARHHVIVDPGIFDRETPDQCGACTSWPSSKSATLRNDRDDPVHVLAEIQKVLTLVS